MKRNMLKLTAFSCKSIIIEKNFTIARTCLHLQSLQTAHVQLPLVGEKTTFLTQFCILCSFLHQIANSPIITFYTNYALIFTNFLTFRKIEKSKMAGQNSIILKNVLPFCV